VEDIKKVILYIQENCKEKERAKAREIFKKKKRIFERGELNMELMKLE